MVSFSLALLRLFQAIIRAWRMPAFRGALWLTLLLLLSGTLFYRGAEGWSWVDSLFYSFMLMTTIGVESMGPQSDYSKIFTMIFAVIGIGVMISLVTMLARALIAEDDGIKK